MRTKINFLLPLCLCTLWLAAGCSTTITNLTPKQLTRTPTGMYPFEVKWDSTQRSVQKDTIQAAVVVGMDTYPMQRNPLVTNRWETVVPIAPDKEVAHYRYKFDYEYLSIPQRKGNSKLSPPYTLKITEK